MKIREIIINDIVENIIVYKDIHEEFISFIRTEIKEDYIPDFSFDEFCIMLINNFDGIDDEINEHLNSDHVSLIDKLLDSVIRIAFDSFKNDEESIIKLQKVYGK